MANVACNGKKSKVTNHLKVRNKSGFIDVHNGHGLLYNLVPRLYSVNALSALHQKILENLGVLVYMPLFLRLRHKCNEIIIPRRFEPYSHSLRCVMLSSYEVSELLKNYK